MPFHLPVTTADFYWKGLSFAGGKKNLKNGKIVVNNSGLSIALLYSCDCTRSALGPPLSSVPPPPSSGGSFFRNPQNEVKMRLFGHLTAGKTPE
jgi:hypothetical protein